MNILQNLHTHCTYCDGKDTPEELVVTALEKGFSSLGFSSHSHMVFSKYPALTPEKEVLYKREIAQLKEKYRAVLDIYCGLEWEWYSQVNLEGYDYIIGSVHYLKVNGEMVGFDRSQEQVRDVIEKHFGGDGMKYAKKYYETVADLAGSDKIDIIGHFDLITKHAENCTFFDTESKEYQRYVTDALDALIPKYRFFEVNTGAIARGYRTAPYPSAFILKELKRRNCCVLLSSDCHDKKHLDCHFRESTQLLRECGFREQYVLTKEGFAAAVL